jgi:hypothetical protein
MNSLKINKAVRNSTFSNKCKLLQQQTVQENELKLDLKPLLANQITKISYQQNKGPLDSQFALKMERSKSISKDKSKITKIHQSSGPLKSVYLAEKHIIQVGDINCRATWK